MATKEQRTRSWHTTVAEFRALMPELGDTLAALIETDKRTGIVNDPNRTDDPQYIVKLIGKVITVSLETVNITNNLPTL